jgi:hypothetical protein
MACYGLERGRLREGGKDGSAWWREIVRIKDGVGGIRDGWFGKSVTRKVGTGQTHFSGPIPDWAGSICVRDLGACMI